jgi:hypothetical protein
MSNPCRLVLSALTAAAGLASPLALAGGPIDLCEVKQMGMPDFDQRRFPLGANGSVHCVPTSISNILGYFATRGLPQAFPGVDKTWGQEDYTAITNNIAVLGNLMSTGLPNGTNGGNGFDGLADWIDDRVPGKIGVARLTGGYVNPTYMSIWRNLMGGFIAPCYGRYERDGMAGGAPNWTRNGGHCVTLYRLQNACQDPAIISFRDPASDEGDTSLRLFQQSGSAVTVSNLYRRAIRIDGDLKFRWGLTNNFDEPLRLFDSMYVLIPMFQLTSTGPNVAFAPAFDLINQSNPPTFNTGANVLNHSLSSGLTSVTLVQANRSGTPANIARLDLATGLTHVMRPTTSKHFAHGRRGQVYYIDGNDLVAVDDWQTPQQPPVEIGRVTLSGPVEAIAVDPVNDQVCVALAAVTAGPRLARFSKTLSPIATNFYPSIPGSGELKLKPGPQSGQWHMARVGDQTIKLVLPPGTPTGSFTNGPVIDLPGTDSVQDFNFHAGRFVYSTPVIGTPNFVTRGAKLDTNNRWIADPDSPFHNRTGGAIMSFMTHMDTFDPALDGPIDQEIGPAIELLSDLSSTPDCIADIASAGQFPDPDGQLTADDIILFINRFFAADERADIAGTGQTTGADGNFSADDIILYINRFFAGC